MDYVHSVSASISLPSAQRKSRSSLYSWAELLSCPRSWLALFCQDRRQTNENADNAVFSLPPSLPPCCKITFANSLALRSNCCDAAGGVSVEYPQLPPRSKWSESGAAEGSDRVSYAQLPNWLAPIKSGGRIFSKAYPSLAQF